MTEALDLGAVVVSAPTPWSILHEALVGRRALRAEYHGRLRVLCPHVLGWKNGRAKVLVYQTAVTAPSGGHDSSGWRSLFVDEVEMPTITDDRWHSPADYRPHSTGIDTVAAVIPR